MSNQLKYNSIKSLLLILSFYGIITNSNAQYTISGQVLDDSGQSLIGASVSWSKLGGGTTTDINGEFNISSNEKGDTLNINYIGFKQKSFFLYPTQDTILKVILSEGILINTINITSSKSLASEFSSMNLDKLDIYMNPVSSGDPLRAITLLASSTNADESANPELRGASSNLSAVVINGVPLSNPVKANSLNGLGFFSLINPEILEEMTVYPSNPPLYIGQSTGGLVEIKTANSLDYETIDISLSAANVGGLISKKIQDGKGYIQTYSNYQFSPFFKLVNGKGYNFLNKFSIFDLGVNTAFDLGTNIKIKYLGYFISENNDVDIGLFNYNGSSRGNLKRNFNILNFSSQKENLKFDTSLGFDYKLSKTTFGNLKLNQQRKNWFVSSNIDKYWDTGWVLKTGFNYRLDDLVSDDSYPLYYTSFSPNSDNNTTTISIKNILRNPEVFGFLKYDMNNWIFSAGLRYGYYIGANDFSNYLSAQTNINYNWSNKSKILLGVGNYNKVLQLASTNNTINHIQSQHVTLEYFYKTSKWEIQLASFYRHEDYKKNLDIYSNDIRGVRKKNIYGSEVFIKYHINNQWMISASNTFLKSTSGEGLILNPSFNYFFKGNIQYQSEAIGTIGLAYINRPGKFFNAITEGTFNEELNDYLPIYDPSISENGSQYNMYSNLSLNYSKLFFLKNDMTIIGFISINNLTNSRNVQSEYYNQDYSQIFEETYQPINIYFGAILKL